MPPVPHRVALAALAPVAFAMAAFAGWAARADVLPEPTYVAGLWFYAHAFYNPNTHTPTASPIELLSCQAGHPNCRAANAAQVVGAAVVSVDGVAGADPREVFGAAHPPGVITVVFSRSLNGGRTVRTTVKFAPR